MNRLELLLGIVALILFAAGLLAFLCPAGLWSSLTARGSRWVNQASTAGALLFAGLGLGGAALLLVSVSDVWRGWESERWSEVEATVLAARLIEVRQIRSTEPAYRPEVSYRYTVANREHIAARVDFGAIATPDRETAERELGARFSPGMILTAYYDPQNPAEAVIVPGIQAKAGILGVLGVILVGIAVWQLLALIRDWDGQRLVPASVPAQRRHHPLT